MASYLARAYKTISASSPSGLDGRVNDALSSGWELYGSPYMVNGEYVQAVVKT